MGHVDLDKPILPSRLAHDNEGVIAVTSMPLSADVDLCAWTKMLCALNRGSIRRGPYRIIIYIRHKADADNLKRLWRMIGTGFPPSGSPQALRPVHRPIR